MKSKDFKLGQPVAFSKAYSTRASSRFRRDYVRRVKEPYGCMKDGKGLVMGTRFVIMAEYEYETPWIEDEDCNWPSKGTRETVLLVSYNLHRKPVYVRLCDVLEEP